MPVCPTHDQQNLRFISLAKQGDHKTSRVDPARHNLLRGDTLNMSADELGHLCPFGNLMFDHRLDISLFLLSTVLPLNICYRATAEVIGSVLLRDDISPLSPGSYRSLR